MNLFIAGTYRTSNLIRNAISITDQLQEKANTLSFTLSGNKPSDYDEVKVYEAFNILSKDGTTITIDYLYSLNEVTGNYRVGDTLVIDIGQAGEMDKTITSISSSGGKVQLTVTPAGADGTVGQLAGTKLFAGHITQVKDKNDALLVNLDYSISASDYTVIFNKANVNDTFTDKDSRYIVNSFCNSTINRNEEIDEMNYADNTAIQAEWIESGDGTNPTVDTSDYQEGTSSGLMNWTFAAGTATFSATPASTDVSEFSGAASGDPTKGVIGFWYKCTDYTKVASFQVRIGSDSTNYMRFTITPTSNSWVFEGLKLTDGTKVGTPVWTAVDYIAIVVTETASSSIKFDGFRFLEEQYFRHYPYVQTSATFDDFRVSETKPVEVMQRISDELSWYWYIDYDRNIHLFDELVNVAPFSLTETSKNFNNLQITYDTSRLINRQKVKGGDETSTSFYNQVKEGDSVVREWIMKNRFKNLEVFLDNNTVTHAAEVGTNTTNIKITAHGLLTDDYIVNRSRSNAVRQITKVDADNFTVNTVASQTNGDTISFFSATVVGVEGLDTEAGNDYMSNFNEKSIRAAETTATLSDGQFLQFRYNEVLPIIVKRSENTSITRMKTTLGHSTGIFDGQPIIDRTIKSRTEAIAMAKSVLNKYSNVIITATFDTTVSGLKAGQLISIKDTTSSSRSINQSFVIQSVKTKQFEEGENIYSVTCSSL